MFLWYLAQGSLYWDVLLSRKVASQYVLRMSYGWLLCLVGCCACFYSAALSATSSSSLSLVFNTTAFNHVTSIGKCHTCGKIACKNAFTHKDSDDKMEQFALNEPHAIKGIDS